MAKATKTTARPTPPPRNTVPARPSTPASRAQQAAQHQGRPAPAAVPAAPRGPQRPAAPPANAMTPGSAQVPDFMRQDVDLGKENIDRDDLETPRLKLMQGLSSELQSYDDLRPGHFLHTANEFIFDKPFRAVAVFMDKRYILWRPRDSGGGILARADDGVHWSPAQGDFTVQLDKNRGGKTVTWSLAPTVAESGLGNWGTMDPDDPQSPPAATRMYNFVLVFPDEPDLLPAVLTFQRAGIKRARKFITMLKTTRTPLCGLRFQFSSFMDHNNSGQEFFNVSVAGDGLVEDREQYQRYRDLYTMFKDAGLAVKDIESLQDEVGDEPQDGEAGNSSKF